MMRRTDAVHLRRGSNVYQVCVSYAHQASTESLRNLSVREYVNGAKNSSALLDLLAAESMEGEPDVGMKAGKRKVLYEEVSR